MKSIAFVILAAVSPALVTFSLIGCSEGIDQSKKTSIEQGLHELDILLLDVELIDPAMYLQGRESYIKGDFSNAQLLEDEIDRMLEEYETIIQDAKEVSWTAKENGTIDELRNLVSYLLLSADYMNVSLKLVRKDILAGKNNSIDIVGEMSNNLQNTYRMFFIDEYNSLADQYDLPKL